MSRKSLNLFLAGKGWQYNQLIHDSDVHPKHQGDEKSEEFASNERMRRNATTVDDLKEDVFIVERKVSKHHEYRRLLEDLGLYERT